MEPREDRHSNKRTHVLVLPSWYPSCIGDINGSFFREQALSLSKRGYQVGVIYPQVQPLWKWKEAITVKYGFECSDDGGVKTYRWRFLNYTPRVHSINKRKYVNAGLKLFDKYVQKNGCPDILHVHSLINAGFLAYAIHKKYNVPYVVTEHSTAFARNLVGARTKKDLGKIVEVSKKNIAVSNEFKSLLERELAHSEWVSVPNIVADDFLASPINEETSSDFKFINVCFLTEKKKVDILIRAFSKSFKKNKNIKLEIGGDGPCLPELKKLAEQEGIADQVSFLGMLQRHEVLYRVSKANAFVLSSEYETFGVVLAEALALGKPVIATRCGGPESIVTAEVGFLVEKNSVNKLSQAMISLFESKDQFVARRIRKYCETNYSEESVIQRLGRIYQEALLLPEDQDDKK
ncbi:glycosyltransferase [Pseudomonas stutzeri]|uniref:Glycosyltransferase family 4 protein n=1 Tax=Stutzerimonas stutzeri TaxID=316 RepID=A0A2N8T107_STUST|nr:glycosyltransferase [Stutzerimonas stutzeri]MCQ4251913.1 glycosyltransferase [Stutzerimonas stutzeri]PNG08428.1 glycosyltransferase family 4 protein [Stutzerimonas stutzeri]